MGSSDPSPSHAGDDPACADGGGAGGWLDARSGAPQQRFNIGGKEERPSRQLHFPWAQQATAGDELKTSMEKLISKSKSGFLTRRQQYTWLDWLAVFIPAVRWLRTYNIREYLWADFVAGVSVGFMVIPQGMSYANLAGLPSVYGLYGAFVPVLIYALVGSSRQLAVGPVAVTSMLLGNQLKDLVPGSENIQSPNTPTPEQVPIQEAYNHVAVQVAFLVAVLYTAVGMLRLGFITNFLSHSMIGGFTSGAAITIGLSQLKYMLGVSVARKDSLQEQAELYIEEMHNFKWQEFIMGCMLLIQLIAFKEIGKRSKRFKFMRSLGPITACIISLCCVYIGHVDQKGIKIIGTIPKGLPKPTINWWFPMPQFGKMMEIAVVVMLVDLLESTSIARALAAKNKYELVPNQEITGLGLANFAGAMFSCYTTTGSFSRSAVNNDSGAKTGLAGFITAWVVAFVLLFLTPVFEHLTYNTLAAIIISGLTGLLEYEQAIYLWKVNKLDWLVWMCAFCGVLFINIEIGLGIAIGLALLIVIYESAFPHTALLGRVGSSGVYRNVRQYPDATIMPGVMMVRFDAPLYFANQQYLRDRMRKMLAKYNTFSKAQGVPLAFCILEMGPVTHIDAPGCHALEELMEEFHKAGVQFVLSNPSASVIRSMERAALFDVLGREWVFVTMQDAVQFAQRMLEEKGYKVQPESAVALQAGSSFTGSGSEDGANPNPALPNSPDDVKA